MNVMSIYQVNWKINRGELEGVTLEENGVKVNYVVLDETGAISKEPSSEQVSEPAPLPTDLTDEVRRLREEVVRLRALVETCCRGRLGDG
jgi:dynactin complex subunit